VKEFDVEWKMVPCTYVIDQRPTFHRGWVVCVGRVSWWIVCAWMLTM